MKSNGHYTANQVILIPDKLYLCLGLFYLITKTNYKIMYIPKVNIIDPTKCLEDYI